MSNLVTQWRDFTRKAFIRLSRFCNNAEAMSEKKAFKGCYDLDVLVIIQVISYYSISYYEVKSILGIFLAEIGRFLPDGFPHVDLLAKASHMA